MTKFKGEVFMMKFVACAKKAYDMSEFFLRNSHKDELKKERK